MKLNNIIEKYNYDEKETILINRLYYVFVDYFKDEELIYNAFLNTKFIFSKDINKELNNYYGFKVQDITYSSGAYASDPKMINKSLVVKRAVVAGTLDALIHETSHLIKSYYREYTIDNDILIHRNGFQEIRFKIDNNNLRLISSIGVGLEEASTAFLEEKIINKYFDKNYKSKSYTIERKLYEYLFKDYSLKDILDIETYKKEFNLFDKEIFNKIRIIFDKIYKLEMEIASNNKILQENLNKINKIIKEEIEPLHKEL